MNDMEIMERGRRAEALLSDDLLKEALQIVRFAPHRAFERCAGDPVKLRRAADLLEAANTLQRYLVLALKNGKAAEKKIDRDLQGGRFVRGLGSLVRSRRQERSGPWSEAV